MNYSTSSETKKEKIKELLDTSTQLSNLSSEITGFRILAPKDYEKRTIFPICIEISQTAEEQSKLKFDYEKMEFASSFFQQLINDSSISLQEINKEKLQTFFEEIIIECKEKTRELGKKILVDFLNYKDEEINEELSYLVGKTKFFFSYHQNLLEHLLEVSIFSANFASQINLNLIEAKRAAFFHDIGKVVGQYSDHVIEGIKLANQFKLDNYIIETIQFHHNYETNINNPYLSIVRSMDKLSAGRLGARPFQLEKTKERKEKINSLLSDIKEISKVEFLAGGHIIKIFLKPEEFKWIELENIKKRIVKVVKESDLKYQYNYQFLLKLEFSDSFLLDDY
ncbi:HDIG domain-containing metalloprotein [Mycoplasma parvum]|uniref:HD domain-containing protein n=1 Tax=Mycoplasma parvum str. Indiana TaxID=1403316 RepID=U5NCW2_9MOLU|nr:HDIG domain-containing metalloprotein [Mycoplasma parvum]AGX89267.1 hypothetical protein PRV_02685 [Mycoplasma parvum str. Indiana]